MFSITPSVLGQRLQVHIPSPKFYEALGEDGIRDMVNAHYELLIKSEIANIFPSDEDGIKEAKKNSANFLIQYFGGPQYFTETRGAPMMVHRHMPFKITTKGRLIWLGTYKKVIKELDTRDDLKEDFWGYVNTFSSWMVNSE